VYGDFKDADILFFILFIYLFQISLKTSDLNKVSKLSKVKTAQRKRRCGLSHPLFLFPPFFLCTLLI
jgi:hypothetical protein